MKRTILVLYNLRYVYPVVQSILSHLYAWQAYSQHEVVYVNVAYGWPSHLLDHLHIDAVVFHTRFLGRWSPDKFNAMLDICAPLRQRSCFKVAMPQDEFLNTRVLNEFIETFDVDHILSCAEAPDWDQIYRHIDRNKRTLETTLTGYIDPALRSQVDERLASALSIPQRPIDIGYRAWKAEYWLGRHGQHKVNVAQAVLDHPKAATLACDISLHPDATLKGMAWFDFLMNCKATVGVEGGASVLDETGSIRKLVDDYLKVHPKADFETVRAACFPNEDGQLGLACLSPRHFEACMTKTAQFLVAGHYNGIFKPWEHYVPIEPDYSNLGEVLDTLSEPGRLEAMVNQAYEDIVASEQWTYKTFIAGMDVLIDQRCTAQKILHQEPAGHRRAIERLGQRDQKTWTVMASEMNYHRHKRPLLKKLFYKSQFQWQLHQLSGV